MRRALAVFALVVSFAGVGGCGDEEPSPGDGATDLPTKTIDITVEGEDLTPNGERIEVQVGQPIELVIKADAEGEIHVHSDPEQAFVYGVGTTTLPLTIDKPGVVEVESHALEKTIVQLEVK